MNRVPTTAWMSPLVLLVLTGTGVPGGEATVGDHIAPVSPRWTCTLPGTVTPPIPVGDLLLASTTDTTGTSLAGITASDGHVRWSHPCASAIQQAVRLGNHLCLGTPSGLLSVNVIDGTSEWSVDLPGTLSGLSTDGTWFHVAHQGTNGWDLLRIDPAHGTQVCSSLQGTDAGLLLLHDATDWLPAGRDRFLIAAGTDLLCLQLDPLHLVWHVNTTGSLSRPALVVEDQAWFVREQEIGSYAIVDGTATHTLPGSLLTSFDTRASPLSNRVCRHGQHAVILTGDRDHRSLAGISLQDGTTTWHVAMSEVLPERFDTVIYQTVNGEWLDHTVLMQIAFDGFRDGTTTPGGPMPQSTEVTGTLWVAIDGGTGAVLWHGGLHPGHAWPSKPPCRLISDGHTVLNLGDNQAERIDPSTGAVSATYAMTSASHATSFFFGADGGIYQWASPLLLSYPPP